MSLRVTAVGLTVILALATGQAAAPQAPGPEAVADSQPAGQAAPRLRVIVTTDGEIDDKCSMIRLLLYANELDLEALIYTSSVFHSQATADWAGTDWIQETLAKYGQVHANLLKHDPRYPDEKTLKGRISIGNVRKAGDMSGDTAGSRRIAEILLQRDPRPVWLLGWGGNNTVAQALKSIQENHPKEMERVCKKARLVFTLNQDETLRDYVRPNWPDLTIIGAYGCWNGIGYGTSRFVPKAEDAYYASDWMLTNVTRDHGALLAHRPNASGGLFVGEGDSITFLHLIPNGLWGAENPSYGSWGGRFENEVSGRPWWGDALDDFDVFKTVWRWAPHFQNDLAARADWCVRPYDHANHPPEVALEGSQDVTASPGQRVTLRVTATDGDRDELAYLWWHYSEPGTYLGQLEIRDSQHREAVVIVPADAQEGDTLHVVCQVTDKGTPPLTRYRQVKITVQSASPSQFKPASAPAANKRPFVLGVNFGGEDVVIEDNPWRGLTTAQAKGLTVTGAKALTRPEAPDPKVDDTTVGMLQSTITGEGDFSISQALPDDTYHVYLWVFEWGDFYWSFSRVFDVEMEGQTLGRNVGALKTMAWRKYGPFVVRVSDGRLDIQIRKKNREPHVAGLSIHKAP